MNRLEIASKILGWKKATWQDLIRELESSNEELLGYSDVEFIEVLCYYANSVGIKQ
jgi:hypothetical protein